MLPRDIDTYGGERSNARVVSDPTTQLDAEEISRLLEDVAQLTRTPARVLAAFVTAGTSSPTTSRAKTLWGTGQTFEPTVTRTGVGLFTVAFESEYADALGVDEAPALTFADGAQELLASGFTPRLVYTRASGASIFVALYSVAPALVDTTGDVILVWGY